MEKIAQGHGREANIAQGEAELVPAIILVSRPSPSAFFPYCTRGSAILNWFIVLAGLFEQITKVLLGAIERQVTRKVRSLALADHSKAVCLR